MGVRAAPTMTMGSVVRSDMSVSNELRWRYFAVKDFRHGVNHNVISTPLRKQLNIIRHTSIWHLLVKRITLTEVSVNFG